MKNVSRKSHGRPKTGRLSSVEYKRALIEAGGRVMQLRLTSVPNAALAALQESGEFTSATEAIGKSLIEAAKKRGLLF